MTGSGRFIREPAIEMEILKPFNCADGHGEHRATGDRRGVPETTATEAEEQEGKEETGDMW